MRALPNLFLPIPPERMDYITVRSFSGKKKLRHWDRVSHGLDLKNKWDGIFTDVHDNSWVYVQFEGTAENYFALKSLDSTQSGMSLCNYRACGDRVYATVKVDCAKRNKFLKKINEYISENTKKGVPRHNELMQGIINLYKAVFESFWQDAKELMPTDKESVWCEVWIARPEDQELELESISNEVKFVLGQLGIEYKDQVQHFPGRTIMLCCASKSDLQALIQQCPWVAEFRRADLLDLNFLDLPNSAQSDLASKLEEKIIPANGMAPAVTILDTGVNRYNLLLRNVISPSDCLSVVEEWGTGDDDGHGTNMSSVALYGDIRPLLTSGSPVVLDHVIESVKVLPPTGANDPKLYGDITQRAVATAESEHPNRTRVICMAVTSADFFDRGRPSSWSAAIDELAFGRDNKRRLVLLAVGNVDLKEHVIYPHCNEESSVQDPAQSWNAISVGAYTELDRLPTSMASYRPVALRGELSPYSSTSLCWDRDYPIKPEIVLEGGNSAVEKGFVSEADELSILAASNDITTSHFAPFRMTSAATALAAKMAASIQAQYPDAWPETVRALMIHSAEWTPELKNQFMRMKGIKKFNKDYYGQMLRFCGYGVPNLGRALACMQNELTLIAEQEIQPFSREGAKFKTKDMHIYELPWPKDVLQNQLWDQNVTMKVTLSYFIDPGPGSLGEDRYKYESFGLRFAINRPEEPIEEFKKRLNKLAREESRGDGDSVKKKSYNGESKHWKFGPKNRSTGSIHSDTITLKGAQMAECGNIAVYPVIGWWRERHGQKRYNDRGRYALVVSLVSPKTDIDIYTPVAIQIKTQVPVLVMI